MSTTASVRALVEEAARAPSSHNTQPWLFEAAEGHVVLRADRRRALPVNDPHDRELTISCGAALLNLEAAAAGIGLGTRTELLPDPADPDHLATVHLLPKGPVDPERARLAAGIERRRTTREPFDGRPLSAGLAAELVRLAERHEARLALVDEPPARERVAGLVAEGDRVQFADPRWRRELAAWMRPRRRGDGLTVPELVGPATRLVVTALDLGGSTARKDRRLATSAPLLAVLATDGDDPASWLRAGRALEAVLLHAAERDVQAGYLNQPCQVAELRPRLREALGVPGLPQVVVRLGHAPPRRPSPRRPVERVLLRRERAASS